jgi:hypothetical protein
MEVNANGSLRVWYVLGLALFVRLLLPISAYLYTCDSTIFYTGLFFHCVAIKRNSIHS